MEGSEGITAIRSLSSVTYFFKTVHLVFHHSSIVKIKSGLLEGDYKDRRMMYLRTMQEVEANKKELENIMNELVTLIENNNQ